MELNERTAASEKDVGCMITNISNAIRQYFDRMFADFDLTYPQSRVLTRLFAQIDKGNVNQRDLEYALGIKASSVSSLVRNLEQKGFIECCRLPEDTRNKQIFLTDKGLEVQEHIDRARNQAEAEMTRGLSEQQVKTFVACLEQVQANLGMDES